MTGAYLQTDASEFPPQALIGLNWMITFRLWLTVSFYVSLGTDPQKKRGSVFGTSGIIPPLSV